MMFKNRVRTLVMTLALGLGVWTLAFTYQAADFQQGDVLSAAELNNLLNDNFDAAQTAVVDLETDVGALQTDVSDLQSDKVDRGGDVMSGQLRIEGDATDVAEFTSDAVFYVDNERTGSNTGVTALFSGETDDDGGVVSIKNDGAGPALTLKSNGGGPLISGGGPGSVTLVVDADGSVQLGDMGISGTDPPKLHLDAVEGTVSNDVGSGLPLAFGGVLSGGNVRSGTDNWSVSLSGSDYLIEIDGENYDSNTHTTVVTPNSVNRVSARTTSSSDALLVQLFDADGNQVTGNFHFVTYVVPE